MSEDRIDETPQMRKERALWEREKAMRELKPWERLENEALITEEKSLFVQDILTTVTELRKRDEEIIEQSRLLGISGSREAELLAKVAKLEFELKEKDRDETEREIVAMGRRLAKAIEGLEAIKKHQETAMKGEYRLSTTWLIASNILTDISANKSSGEDK